MTNKVTRGIFYTDLIYSCAHFVIEIDENLALMAGFNTTSWRLVIVAYFLGHPVGYYSVSLKTWLYGLGGVLVRALDLRMEIAGSVSSKCHQNNPVKTTYQL